MKVPPPTIVGPLVGGALLTFLVHPGGEASSLTGALWALIQLGLVAVPCAAGLNLLVPDRRKDAVIVLSAWVGAGLTFLIL